LSKQIADLTKRLATTESGVTDIDRRLDKLTGNVEKLAETARDYDSRIQTLNKKFGESTTRANTELDTMRQQLDEISVKDGGHYVPNISSAMNSSDKFRQDMDVAVNSSLKQSGVVNLINKTGVGHWVYINRTG